MKTNILFCGLGSAMALTGSYPYEKAHGCLQLSVCLETEGVFVTGTEGHVVIVRSCPPLNSWLWEWGRKCGAHKELPRHPLEMMLDYSLLGAFSEQISDKKDGDERDVVSWLGRCVEFVAEGLSFRSWCLSDAHSAKITKAYFNADIDLVCDFWRAVLSNMRRMDQATYSSNSEERGQNLCELPRRLDLFRDFCASSRRTSLQETDLESSTTNFPDGPSQSLWGNSASVRGDESPGSSWSDIVVDWQRTPP